MRSVRRAFAFVVLISMSACATNSPPDPSRIAAGVEVSKSDFKSVVTWLGPVARGGSIFDGYGARLRSFEDGGVWEHQVYVTLTYQEDWRFYTSAGWFGGEAASMKVIDRKVGVCRAGCSFEEIVGVHIYNDRLVHGLTDGLRLGLFAKSGHETSITLTPEYIQGYLGKLWPERYPLSSPGSS